MPQQPNTGRPTAPRRESKTVPHVPPALLAWLGDQLETNRTTFSKDLTAENALKAVAFEGGMWHVWHMLNKAATAEQKQREVTNHPSHLRT